MDAAYNLVKPIIKGSEVDEFIGQATSFFGWSTPKDQIVMDIGCGVGNTTTYILKKFPEVYKILGIDMFSEYIDVAKREQSHNKIDYQVADISKRQTAIRWNMLIHKAISVFHFNYVEDVKTAYRNLFKMLAYEGEAAIYLNLHSGYYDYITEMFFDPKWSPYTKEKKLLIPQSHKKKLDASYHTELLKEVGFYPVYHMAATKIHRFPTREEFENKIVLSCPHAENIPTELKLEFRDCAIRTFLKYNERDENGIPCVKHEVVSLFFTRPWQPLYGPPASEDSSEEDICSTSGEAYYGQATSGKLSNGQVTTGKLSNGNVSTYTNGNAVAAEMSA